MEIHEKPIQSKNDLFILECEARYYKRHVRDSISKIDDGSNRKLNEWVKRL